ncbi:hypothetical protein C8A00DRAFT_36724 [Chaetomidium leptoderma]|uniref:Uncharacterized protein n=1 Tax=Chaetomidium leptoderma TaxID=669021 RepID=A0AAN6ZSW1_9PEZI|nr:hypothetical protein C8A00DRAFT_36724 [Chaetomidium leptoderma]
MVTPSRPLPANTALQPAKRYWIDVSCDEAAGGDFEQYIHEARHWARRAFERLSSASDTDFARVFNVLFKTPKTDTTPCSKPSFWQQVNGIQPEDQWQPSIEHARTDNREAADVRIYSSPAGLSRWKMMTPHDDTLYDPINHIHLTGDWTNLTSSQAFISWVLPQQHPNNNIPGSENPHRSTIDICPSAWHPSGSSGSGGGILSLSQIDPALFTTTNITDLESPTTGTLLPRLLFHEFMHTRAYLLDDHPHDGGGTSGWGYCMRREKGEAAGCAESLALLGLWAALADLRPGPAGGTTTGGFTVDRGWDLIPGGWEDLDLGGFSDDEEGEGEEEDEEGKKWDADWCGGNSAVRGELRFYGDLTN